MSTASSSFTFNKGAAEFVPKNKIVKTEESFPTLDAIVQAPAKAQPKKAQTAAAPKKEDKKDDDPCKGQPKDFFTLFPVNPMMEADPSTNPLTPTFDQMTFIYIHYPEYAANPVDIITWLYQMALFNEYQANASKRGLEGDISDIYKKAPLNKRSKVKGKGRRDDESEEDDEDVQYLNMRDLRKKKPEPAPQKIEISQEMLEKRKKQKEQNAVK